MCVVNNDVEKVGSVFTHACIPSTHWRQRHKSHSDAIEITLKKLTYLANVWLRVMVMAPTRKTTHL